jgi:hypothetical protein
MSGSFYTPYSFGGGSPGSAFRSGFAGAQELERNAQQLEEADQLMKLRQLQNERNAAAEARTAQMFPLQFTASELAVKQAARTAPFEVERAGLTNKQLEAQIANLRTQINERAAVGRALSEYGNAFPSYTPSGTPAPTTPGVRVPGTTPGFMAPEAVVPTAPAAPAANVPGPQSSILDRYPGSFQTASAGISDSTGLPSGVTPEMINGQPGVVVSAEAPAAPAGVVERPTYTGRPISQYSDVELRNVLRAAIPGGGGPSVAGLAALAPDQREALVTEARLELARRASPSRQYVGTPEMEYGSFPGLPTAANAPVTGTPLPQTRPDFGPSNVEYPDLTPGQVRQAGEDQTAAQRLTQSQTPSDIYITEPARVGQDQQRLQRQLTRLQAEFRVAVAARDREGASRLSREAETVVEQLRYLDGMTAITRLRVGDAAPVADQMYTASGNRMQLQPRSDGTFNVYLDGQVVNQGVTRQQIETSARSLFDTRYREQMQATQTRNAELAMYQAKQRIEQLTRASADIAVKEVEAALKAREPNLDVRTLTDANGQQSLVITDKRTGAPISSARIIKLPPAPGTTAERFTIEVLPVTR